MMSVEAIERCEQAIRDLMRTLKGNPDLAERLSTEIRAGVHDETIRRAHENAVQNAVQNAVASLVSWP